MRCGKTSRSSIELSLYHICKMNALVGYGTSDEEDEMGPEKPAKVGHLYDLLNWKAMDTLLIR